MGSGFFCSEIRPFFRWQNQNPPLTDGTRVQARGDNAFPEHYFDAMNEMWEILEQMTEDGDGMKLHMHIGETGVPVTREKNASVEALRKPIPLTVQRMES